MKRAIVGALMVLLGCGSPEPPPAVQASPPPAAAPKSEARPPSEPAPRVEVTKPWLRVATYNVLAAKRGVEGIVRTLVDLDADLIAVQEIDRFTRRFGRVDLVDEFAAALGFEHAFARHRKYQGGEIGVALLSRFPITDTERIGTPGSGLGMLLATVRTARGPLRVLVVHFHPTDPRHSHDKQRRTDRLRARESANALRTALAQTQPTIVLGDFNARPNGPEYAAFAEVLADACPDSPATWPTPISLVRLDYIWLSSQLQARGCPVVTSTASDHRPVIAELDPR